MAAKARKVQKLSPKENGEVQKTETPAIIEKPQPGYVNKTLIAQGVKALKTLVKKQPAGKQTKKAKKSLLEAGDKDSAKTKKVIIEVVFKNIPCNSKTYIHNIVLPHHWRKELEADEYDIALFVPHLKPKNDVEKIQFSKDRDLDIDNTHTHYQNLLSDKLDEQTRARISRIITSKELATEFNTHQKIDRLSKTYDLFLGDKKLMSNKFNALPRRLGRRFWVREKKVPLIVKLDASDLDERFNKALSTEPFYVVGRSSTERIQLGLLSQNTTDIVSNIQAFLDRLYNLYGDNVRFLKLRSNAGLALPLFADLSSICHKRVTMKKKKAKPETVVGDFDLIPGYSQVSVHPSGTVKIIRAPKTKRKIQDESDGTKPTKKAKK